MLRLDRRHVLLQVAAFARAKDGSGTVNKHLDEYQEGLKGIIDAKIAGQEIVAPAAEAPAKVVNLMDALRKSLDAVSAQKKRPAKALPAAQPAGKRKRA